MKDRKAAKSGGSRVSLQDLVRHGRIAEGTEVAYDFKQEVYKGTMTSDGIQASYNQEVYKCPTAFISAVWKKTKHWRQGITRPHSGWGVVKIIDKNNKPISLKKLKDELADDFAKQREVQDQGSDSGSETLLDSGELPRKQVPAEGNESDTGADGSDISLAEEDDAECIDCQATESNQIVSMEQELEETKRLLQQELKTTQAAIDTARAARQEVDILNQERQKLQLLSQEFTETKARLREAQASLDLAMHGDPLLTIADSFLEDWSHHSY